MKRSTGVTIAAALVTAGGCSSESGKASANVTAPVNATAPANVSMAMNQTGNATASAPADVSGARALLERHYAQYRDGASISMPPYTPELVAAIRRTSGMEDGGLDHDPFCACQDFQNFTSRIESVEPTSDGARARVAINNMGDARTVVIRLVNRGGTWMIADVGEGEDSLLNQR